MKGETCVEALPFSVKHVNNRSFSKYLFAPRKVRNKPTGDPRRNVNFGSKGMVFKISVVVDGMYVRFLLPSDMTMGSAAPSSTSLLLHSFSFLRRDKRSHVITLPSEWPIMEHFPPDGTKC